MSAPSQAPSTASSNAANDTATNQDGNFEMDGVQVHALPRRAPKRRRDRMAGKGTTDYAVTPVMEEKSFSKVGMPAVRKAQYEYLDHTADIQLHAWGSSITEAFEHVGVAMFGYMTELEKVEMDPECTSSIEAKGHDMKSLLFSYLDELLTVFTTEDVVCKEVRIQKFDKESWTINATGYGEKFSLQKHPQGTEIKAITYSAMQIYEKEDKSEVFVVVDI